MKLSKHREKEMTKAYNAYWEGYLKGDVKNMASLLAKGYTQVGSAEGEVFFTKKEAVRFLYDTIDQVAGKLDMRNRDIKIEVLDDLILVNELADIYVLIEQDWAFYSRFRASTLMKKKKEEWKIIHQHSSFPDARTQEGENIAIEKMAEENLRLRNAIKRRTIELEQKNRELEIETALEKVRAVAMGMKHAADMPDICKAIALQLQSLGVNEIRNVQTAIFYEDKETYMNYEYYAKHDKTIITETSYTNHQIHIDFAAQMLKGKGEFFTTRIKGKKKLNDWIAYQKTTNVFIDPFIETAKSLNYYWYSLGPVALGTSTYQPLTENETGLFKRFLKVFELSYRRYLDIEKAEAQAREAKIEAALEKIRGRSLGMHHSVEIKDVVAILFEKLKELDLAFDGGAAIHLFTEGSGNAAIWVASPDLPEPSCVNLPYDETAFENNPIIMDVWNAKETGEHIYNKLYSFEEKNTYFNYVFKHNDFISIPKPSREFILQADSYTASFIAEKNSLLGANSWTRQLFSDNDFDVLKRIARVFEQAYIRFLDLQKAEAQSREAQVELSLERVRAKTMAMHNSQDVGDTVAAMFDEVVKLGIQTIRCGIGIMHEPGEMEIWTAKPDGNGKVDLIIGQIDMMLHPLLEGAFNGWRNKQELYTYDLLGDDLIAYFTAINNYPGYPIKYDIASLPSKIFHSEFHFPEGTLFVFSLEKLSTEALKIFKRFAGVFGQTYRRYLDLKKAEAQAREAQIETALERVRSVAMSMMKSNDLLTICKSVFTQLQILGFTDLRAAQIYIRNDEEEKFLNYDYSETTGADVVEINYNSHPNTRRIYDVIRSAGDGLVDNVIEKKDLEEWKSYLYDTLGQKPEKDLETAEELHYYLYSFGIGAFGICTFKTINIEELEILKRFRNVFNLSYQRYSDIALAEAQTRQAKIEAAMEKVRSRAMAMQKPDELVEVAQLLRTEMGLLGVEELETSSIYIHNETSGITECWYAIQKDNKLASDHMELDLHDTWAGRQMLDFYRSDQKQFSIVMQGENREEWISYCAGHSGVLAGFYGKVIPDRVYHLYKFSNGYMGAVSPGAISPESWDLLQRAASVFSLAYTRFSDLQLAEAQAREARVETALERVRSRTLAMQKSDELAETAAVLFKQLIGLGIAPNRLYIGIINNDEGEIEFWITDEDGSKVSTMFSGNAHKNVSMKKMFDGWKEQKKFISIDMQGTELEDYFRYLGNELHVPFKGGLEQKRRLQYIAYFSKGFIGMASPEVQPAETVTLLERFSYVFNLTFTRFNDLKIAEAHALQAEEDLIKLHTEKKRAEEALTELRATQAQLIQAEKMASLGQLTAGIAHEIQNPLNFVNNFSEVSEELIKEMVDEVNKGNMNEVKAIAGDLVQNLEKIYHHGKRADSIVKGMLEHSRTSAGNMEPTDINALADEYLRLSYHGFRAKDKLFNTAIHTDFDNTIDKINIIGQDIGRVLLNLYNNAFYAVNEKKKQASTGFPTVERLETLYDPTVSVSTKKMGDKVVISVKDNGNGIPQNIVDKIFQPFFTTKPTGQGTGLGLSLAYDIIKAHGGELKVETREGEGSLFIIQLSIV